MIPVLCTGCPPYAFPIFDLALVPVHGLPWLFCDPALWLFSKPLFRTVAQLCQYLCVSVSSLSLPFVLLRSLSGSSMEVVFPTVYGLCSCIKKMLIPLAGKRFERCNFLVLRPVLLKNAYFSSPNRELSKVVRLVELG